MIAILFGILTVAVLADLATCRIPNALIYVGLIGGLIAILLDNGPPGLTVYIIRTLSGFAIFYLLYISYALGSGDVKLLIVIASYLGVKQSIRILFISMVIGATYGCIKKLISSKQSIINLMGKLKEGADKSQKTKIYKWYNFDLNTILNNILIYKNKTYEMLIEKIINKKCTKFRYSPAIYLATIIVILEWRKIIW